MKSLIFLFLSFGAAVHVTAQAGRFVFGQAEMLRCGGYCNNDQYLVCASSYKYGSVTFPNHCYMDVASKCYDRFMEQEDSECNYHKNYVYFQPLTCQTFTNETINLKSDIDRISNVLKGIEQKAGQQIDEIRTDFARFFGVFNLTEEPYYSTVVKEAREQINQSLTSVTDALFNCSECTRSKVFEYRDCLKTSAENVNATLNEIKNNLNKFVEQIKSPINNLKTQLENILNGILTVSQLKDYYSKKLEVYHSNYLKAKQNSQNYLITNDIITLGKTIADSFKKAVAIFASNSRCSLASELNRLIRISEEVITPFSSSKYPVPSLEEFAKAYGGVVEDSGIAILVKGYEKAFSKAEESLRNVSKNAGPSGAFNRLGDVLKSEDELLDNATTCLRRSEITDDEGQILDLLSCLSSASCTSESINDLKLKVTECSNQYSLNRYCLNGVSKGKDRFGELVVCLSLAIKSSNKDDISCCFK